MKNTNSQIYRRIFSLGLILGMVFSNAAIGLAIEKMDSEGRWQREISIRDVEELSTKKAPADPAPALSDDSPITIIDNLDS